MATTKFNYSGTFKAFDGNQRMIAMEMDSWISYHALKHHAISKRARYFSFTPSDECNRKAFIMRKIK